MSTEIEISGKGCKDLKSAMEQSFKDAITKSIEFTYAKVYEYCPTGKTRKGPISIRPALRYEIDMENSEAFIGIPKGSEAERIAFYLEMGTGERGATGWTQYFDEKHPAFTVPIVPLHAKVLHWVDDSGKDVFAKKTKGQKPQSFLRRGVYDSKPYIEKIWKDEFSESKLKSRIKMVPADKF